jgi:hypothetical protein
MRIEERWNGTHGGIPVKITLQTGQRATITRWEPV